MPFRDRQGDAAEYVTQRGPDQHVARLLARELLHTGVSALERHYAQSVAAKWLIVDAATGYPAKAGNPGCPYLNRIAFLTVAVELSPEAAMAVLSHYQPKTGQ